MSNGPPTKKEIPPPTPENVLPPNRKHGYFVNHEHHPFRPDTHALVNAWWLAESALLAYASLDFAKSRFETAGFTLAGRQPFSKKSTQCYVAHKDDFAIVAFRGTQVLKPGANQPLVETLRQVAADIYLDGKFGLVKWDGPGLVHQGFLDGLNDVWKPVSEHLADLRTKLSIRHVWFTGHSLGAALATLAAQRFDKDANQLVTFGSPLVGDAEFAKRTGAGVRRFVNNNDIVTRIPPVGRGPARIDIPILKNFSRPVLAYRHIGDLHYFGGDGSLQTGDDAESLDTKTAESSQRPILQSLRELKRAAVAATKLDALTDHAPLYYAIHTWNNCVVDAAKHES